MEHYYLWHMRLAISHTTRYLYSFPARSNINELRLAPEENSRQKPGSLTLTIDPVTELSESRDLFGNLVHYFEIEGRHESLMIRSDTEVETISQFDLPMRAMSVPLRNMESETGNADLHQFLVDSHFVSKNPETWREAIDIHLDHEKTWGALIQALNDYIFDSCTFRDQILHIPATSVDVQRDKVGTCQDFAHLLISYCRALGMPARYISGYMYDPGLERSENAAFVGSGQSHAWVEVHVPRLGWIGIDPTNRKWVDEHYVSVAFGRDYHDVAPIRGSLIGGGEERRLEVSVDVRSVK